MDQTLAWQIEQAWRLMDETDYLSDVENGGSGTVYRRPRQVQSQEPDLDGSGDSGKQVDAKPPTVFKNQNGEEDEETKSVGVGALKEDIDKHDLSDCASTDTIKEKNTRVNCFKREHAQGDHSHTSSSTNMIKKEEQIDDWSHSLPLKYLKEEEHEKEYQSSCGSDNTFKEEFKKEYWSDSDSMHSIKEENYQMNHLSEDVFKREHVQGDNSDSSSSTYMMKKEEQIDDCSDSLSLDSLTEEKHEEKHQSASRAYNPLKGENKEEDNQFRSMKLNSVKEESDEDPLGFDSESGDSSDADEMELPDERTMDMTTPHNTVISSCPVIQQSSLHGDLTTTAFLQLSQTNRMNAVCAEASHKSKDIRKVVGVKAARVRNSAEKLPERKGEDKEQCSKDSCWTRVLRSRSNITKETDYRTEEQPFECRKCRKTFSVRSDLKKHVGAHTEGRPYECNECGKSFTQKKSLNRHTFIHTGERPFKCGECGKSFTRSGHLSTHMTTHTGERPFQCKECRKSFAERCHLIRHVRFHIGDRPFKCDECKKSFTQKCNLITHMRLHTGDRPFRCNECGKSFTYKSSLNTHMHTHTGERPFKCNECGKSFKQEISLTKHVGTHTDE